MQGRRGRPVAQVAAILALCAPARGQASAECDAARASRVCDDCFWKVHPPAEPGKYRLMRTFDSPESVARDWVCYLGRSGMPAPVKSGTNANGDEIGWTSFRSFAHDFLRDYYYDVGPSPVSYEEVVGTDASLMPWRVDPTEGMNRYDLGCAYMGDLLTARDDGQPGFMLRAMRPPTLSELYLRSNPDWVAATQNDVYTLRLHTKDAYNGGFFAISVAQLPYGAAAWPAFWLLGEQSAEWLTRHPRRRGLGLRTRWPQGGEIDIIEYINAHTREDHGQNAVTLHEPPGCFSNRSSPSGRGDTSQGSDDCNLDRALLGCSMKMPAAPSAARARGAIFACDWVQKADGTPERVDCWFFRKNATAAAPPPAPPAVVEVRVTLAAGSDAWRADDLLVLFTRRGGRPPSSRRSAGRRARPAAGAPALRQGWESGPRTFVASWSPGGPDTYAFEVQGPWTAPCRRST